MYNLKTPAEQLAILELQRSNTTQVEELVDEDTKRDRLVICIPYYLYCIRAILAVRSTFVKDFRLINTKKFGINNPYGPKFTPYIGFVFS